MKFLFKCLYLLSSGIETCPDPDLETADNSTFLTPSSTIRSIIHHDCGPGRVFTDTLKQTRLNYCIGKDGIATWQFNVTNKMPDCIRKF